MNHHEHAQQIFSMILAGWASSGRPLPGTQEAESYAQMSINYSKAFAKVAEKKGD